MSRRTVALAFIIVSLTRLLNIEHTLIPITITLLSIFSYMALVVYLYDTGRLLVQKFIPQPTSISTTPYKMLIPSDLYQSLNPTKTYTMLLVSIILNIGVMVVWRKFL